jgi:hypothetical protein
MAMVVIVAVVVVPMVPTIIIPMLFLVTRNVLAVVPVVLHEEDPLAAGVVFAAVLAPMFGLTRRDAQIDRRAFHRYPFDHNGLTVDYLNVQLHISSITHSRTLCRVAGANALRARR